MKTQRVRFIIRLIIGSLIFMSCSVFANVCGTDYQTFNPTTNGLDFVTVQSSETIKPCYLNFGAFVNYAINTLTYSENYTDSNGQTFEAGKKPNDKIWGLDLGVGFGLNDKWDLGFSVPFVLDQKLEEDELNSNYKTKGATEIKVNSKYRFSGDEKSGLAVVASLNHNLIKNNPFSGKNSNPTFNLELVGDKNFGDWAAAVNLGYRWRNPGEKIEDVPFEPLGNQVIYSVATSYYAQKLDTKFIFEIFGGKYETDSNEESEKKPDSLEWLFGLKHDVSNNMALHVGMGAGIESALGSPEQRIYAGINWAIGSFCEDKKSEVVTPEQEPVVLGADPNLNEGNKLERLRVSAEVLFDFDSANLRNADIPELDTYFANLDRKNITKIVVEGHTDSRGNALYNLDLSKRRAVSVKAYLLRKFSDLTSEKIQTEGYGEERPVADNANYQGRQKNRRVEFEIGFNEL